MPSREEIARWLRKAGEKHCIGHKYPTYSKLCEERSLQVENMRCENCSKHFEITGDDGEGIPCLWSGSGGCWNFDPKEN